MACVGEGTVSTQPQCVGPAALRTDIDSCIPLTRCEHSVYFFYRPKVRSADKAESNSTKSLDDVQNTFMLLVPRASESNTAPAKGSKKEADEDDKRKPPNPTAYRLVSLGKKRMPSPDAALKAGQEPGGIGGRHSEAIWATVADIGADLNNVAKGMGEERYSTKTRGEFSLHRVAPRSIGQSLTFCCNVALSLVQETASSRQRDLLVAVTMR